MKCDTLFFKYNKRDDNFSKKIKHVQLQSNGTYFHGWK